MQASASFLKGFLFIFVLVSANAAGAQQVPLTLSHQGRLVTEAGPVNGSIIVRFRLYDQSGLLLEQDQGIVCVDGYYSVAIDLATDSADPLFDKIIMASRLYLGIYIEDVGELQPLFPVSSVPYALVSQWAHEAHDVVCNECIQREDVAFSYAAGATKGGPATGLTCDQCVNTADLADGSVSPEKLQHVVLLPNQHRISGWVLLEDIQQLYSGQPTDTSSSTWTRIDFSDYISPELQQSGRAKFVKLRVRFRRFSGGTVANFSVRRPGGVTQNFSMRASSGDGQGQEIEFVLFAPEHIIEVAMSRSGQSTSCSVSLIGFSI